MADEYQVIWEYAAAATISFKTDNLQIRYRKPGFKNDIRIDGVKVVSDPGIRQYIFTFTATLSGDEMDTLDSVERGAITYTGAYPRIQKIYWDGDSTETNIEVAIPDGGLTVLDSGEAGWVVSIIMEEKNQ